MGKALDLTGMRFGKWTVINRVENSRGQTRWRCRCDCGTERIVFGHSLSRGETKSCGCTKRKYEQEPKRLPEPKPKRKPTESLIAAAAKANALHMSYGTYVSKEGKVNNVKRMAGPLPAPEPNAGPVISYKLSPDELAKYGSPQMKVCPCCGRELPVLSFRNPTGKNTLYGLGGIGKICRDCQAKRLIKMALQKEEITCYANR